MRTFLLVLAGLGCTALAVLGALRLISDERGPGRAGAPSPSSRPVQAPEDASSALTGGPERMPVESLGDPLGSEGEDNLDLPNRPRTPEEGSETGLENPDDAALLARVEQRFRRQAEYIGDGVDLTASDREHLFQVLLGEYQRRSEFFEELRQNAEDPEMRARVREELAAIQQWKADELAAKLGAELAQAVEDFERNDDRGLFDRSFDRDGKERSEN